jgi:hypothetical protein
MAIEYLPTFETMPTYYIYALLCKDEDGPGYIKLGMSGNVTQRLTSLRTACPIPAQYIATVKVGYDREKCLKVESYLHREFAERKVKMRGEWFRFNFSEPEDKTEFNRGCKRVFRHFFGVAHPWWDIISVEALDKHNEERRREFLHSKHRRKIEAKSRYKAQQRAAWKELG